MAACGTAMQNGERVIVEDVANDPIFKGTPACEVMLKAGVLAVQSTPLRGRSGQPLGMFSIHYRSSRRPDSRDLLAELATAVGEEIQRAKKEYQARTKDEGNLV
jgi:GAF domain-containing protein